MHEIVKLVGGLAWGFGILLLFVSPIFGFFLLLAAVLATIWSVQKTRERRHQELLDAARARTDYRP